MKELIKQVEEASKVSAEAKRLNVENKTLKSQLESVQKDLEQWKKAKESSSEHERNLEEMYARKIEETKWFYKEQIEVTEIEVEDLKLQLEEKEKEISSMQKIQEEHLQTVSELESVRVELRKLKESFAESKRERYTSALTAEQEDSEKMQKLEEDNVQLVAEVDQLKAALQREREQMKRQSVMFKKQIAKNEGAGQKVFLKQHRVNPPVSPRSSIASERYSQRASNLLSFSFNSFISDSTCLFTNSTSLFISSLSFRFSSSTCLLKSATSPPPLFPCFSSFSSFF